MPSTSTDKWTIFGGAQFLITDNGSCPPFQMGYPSPLVTHRVLKQFNEKISRPKPSDDVLIWMMTSVPLVYTTTTISAQIIVHNNHTYNWTQCGFESFTHYEVSRVYTKTLLPDYFQPVQTGWEIALRLKIKDEAMNLASLLVEYRETASMFYDVAKQVHKAYKNLKHGRYYKKQSEARKGIRKAAYDYRLKTWKEKKRKAFTSLDISSSYLQMTYGVMPLVGDLFDIYYRLNLALGRDLVKRFAVKRSATRDLSGTVKGDAGSLSVSQRAIAYVIFNAERTSNFTVGNPAEWVFEATPFSFVLDWLFNIGDIIQSLDALKSADYVMGTLTEKRSASYSINFIENQGLHPNSRVIVPFEETHESYQRTAFNSIPLPQVIRYEPSQSFRTIANGLALLHQLRGK